MKQFAKRLVCMVLCAVMALGMVPGVNASATVHTEHSAMDTITQQYNTYTFTTFEDLKELCEGNYGGSYTLFSYKRSDELVIEEDLTLPEGVEFQMSSSKSKLTIPKGVTLAFNGSFYCPTMNVAGTLVFGTRRLSSFVQVSKALNITGKVTGRTIILAYGATLTGADRVTFLGDLDTFKFSPSVKTEEELRAALATAAKNPTYQYQIQTWFSSPVTIQSPLTIPSNVYIMGMSYDTSVTIASGATVTFLGNASISASLTVKGKLVNHARISAGSPVKFTSTGSYSGKGTLCVHYLGTNPAFKTAFPGLDTDGLETTFIDSYSMWVIRNKSASASPTTPTIQSLVHPETLSPQIGWLDCAGAYEYQIYRAESKDGPYKYLDTRDIWWWPMSYFVYTDTTAEVGKCYYYKVRSVSDFGDRSSFSGVTACCCKLSKPSVSISGSSSSGKPIVKWETVEGAAKYYIYRSTSKSSGYTRIKTAVSARSYTDTTAKAGTNYYYKVKAIHADTDANSGYSSVVNRVCDLKRPSVTIQLTSGGNPYLKWREISGAEKYYVYRAASKSGTYKRIGSTTAEKYINKDVTAGKTYYYKVKAVHARSSANSAYSPVQYIKAK